MNNITQKSHINAFGQLLRTLRKRKGLSQLKLSEKADTTPRYISFLETGRSRPSRGMVLRIATALDIANRELNSLLANAGLASSYIGDEMNHEEKASLEQVIQTILDNHEPYPACAVDTLSRIVLTNNAFERFLPGLSNRTAEQSIDNFFGSKRIREFMENWSEVAWAFIDRRQLEAIRSNDPRLFELSARALAHMEGVERPLRTANTTSMMIHARFRVDGRILSTYATVMRFENVEQIALSDLRLELMHPNNQETADFFKALAQREYNT